MSSPITAEPRLSPLSPSQLQELDQALKFQPGHKTLLDRPGPIFGDLKADLISLPDFGTGQRLVLPRVIFGQPDLVLPIYEHEGQASPSVAEMALSPEQTEAISFAANTCHLPYLVAADLVLNLGYDQSRIVEEFEKSDQPVPAIIGLAGFSLQGKTLLAVELRRRGEVVVSLDGFSSEGFESYWQIVTNNGLKDTSSHSTEEVVSRIVNHPRSAWDQSAQPKPSWTLRQALDRLEDLFRHGQRPELVVVDLPGYRYEADPVNRRMLNIFDWFSLYGLEVLDIQRFEPEAAGYSRAFESATDYRVISDYLESWEELRSSLISSDRLRHQLLLAATLGNSDEASHSAHRYSHVKFGQAMAETPSIG